VLAVANQRILDDLLFQHVDAGRQRLGVSVVLLQDAFDQFVDVATVSSGGLCGPAAGLIFFCATIVLTLILGRFVCGSAPVNKTTVTIRRNGARINE